MLNIQHFDELARKAIPLNDDDYGTPRQIDAENEFFDEARKVLGEEPLYKYETMKASTEEMIDLALVELRYALGEGGRRQLTDPGAIKDFILAGNSTFTIVSDRTGRRFTYRVRGKKDEGSDDFALWFVSVMSGPDNESDFTYLGVIRPNGAYFHGSKSKIDKEHMKSMAWRFLWQFVVDGQMAPDLQFWHEGKCGRCGRKLTVPASIELGLGPECAKRS